ncbi:hypothetical protein LSCM4_02617 [Leishmania orientalis]|uniref:Uncharacterized protein n=1 Tax=Leishmania orientalis TaxID=2249476 RepID=A0A836KAF2_9TRYP|nr:hypothetical protein LSCM4_02617 [Leishmania orientalis]
MFSIRFRGVDLDPEMTPPMLCGALSRKAAPLRPTVSPVDSEADENAGSRGLGVARATRWQGSCCHRQRNREEGGHSRQKKYISMQQAPTTAVASWFTSPATQNAIRPRRRLVKRREITEKALSRVLRLAYTKTKRILHIAPQRISRPGACAVRTLFPLLPSLSDFVSHRPSFPFSCSENLL